MSAGSLLVCAETDWERRHARNLNRLALALLLLGIFWRVCRYALCFPIWGDEAMLLLNYCTRSYLDIFGPIDNSQVAPLLFHWAEIALIQLFGTSEFAVRLPALLASLCSLGLFARLVWLALPGLARTLALGILAVSIWPANMGSLCKPYSFDLFFSLALLVPAITWLRQPERLAPLITLVFVVAVAVLSSYPAVFVAGAVSLALLPVVWQRRNWRNVVLFVVYNLVLVSFFFGHYYFVSRPHLASPLAHLNTQECMHLYWLQGFPPSSPLQLLWWLVLAHTGQVAAYPVGSANGGSLLTVLLCCVGLAVLWRQRRSEWFILVGATFGLWFVAAILHKYPYGASCRLAQHVAPFYCLLAGLGLATLLSRLLEGRRWPAILGALAVLGMIGAIGIARDFYRPYRDEEARWARQQVDDLLKRSGQDPIVLTEATLTSTPLVWNLLRLNLVPGAAPRVFWLHELKADHLPRQQGSMWVLEGGPRDRALVEQQLGQDWRCTERDSSAVRLEGQAVATFECRLGQWVRGERKVTRSVGE